MARLSVLHFATTPVAGAPMRICRALQSIGVDARLVVLNPQAYGSRTFRQDLIWSQDRDTVVELAQSCDVIHLHNTIGLDTRSFAPIDFRALWNAGKPMVRQYHSHPATVARYANCALEELIACPVPRLVCAQAQERFYPTARLVPNIVFDTDGEVIADWDADRLSVCFSPSSDTPARAARWETKAYPETVAVMRRVRKALAREGSGVGFDVITGVPLDECLERKTRSHFAIDDLVTGGYHLSALESLMLGQVTLGYLDARTLGAIFEISGRTDIPLVNVPLEAAEDVLLDLLCNRDVARGIATASRAWMREHWSADRMAEHYRDAYVHAVTHPGVPFERRFADSQEARWLAERPYDAAWRRRVDRAASRVYHLLGEARSSVGWRTDALTRWWRGHGRR